MKPRFPHTHSGGELDKRCGESADWEDGAPPEEGVLVLPLDRSIKHSVCAESQQEDGHARELQTEQNANRRTDRSRRRRQKRPLAIRPKVARSRAPQTLQRSA